MASARYEAAFFDVGNTLLRPFPSVSHVVEEILGAAGHTHDVGAIESFMPLLDEYYEDRFKADDTFWTSEEETSDVWVGMYSLLCRKLGAEDEAENLARVVYEEFGKAHRWRPFDDVLPALGRIRDAGVRIGIISNWDPRLESILDGLGVGALVDTVVCSAAVGLHKPNPLIFELACDRIGVTPKRAVHIGDHVYSDILGARAAGLSAVLIDRSGDLPGRDASSMRSVPCVRSLADLEEHW